MSLGNVAPLACCLSYFYAIRQAVETLAKFSAQITTYLSGLWLVQSQPYPVLYF